jgi:hypothetical protein
MSASELQPASQEQHQTPSRLLEVAVTLDTA